MKGLKLLFLFSISFFGVLSVETYQIFNKEDKVINYDNYIEQAKEINKEHKNFEDSIKIKNNK